MHCSRLLALALVTVVSLVVAHPAQSAMGIAQGAMGSAQNAHCLALAMYWEAKSEGRDGMLAVASVVLNRVAHPEFPDSVCAVVKQGGESPPCQFSWWCDGKSDQPTEARAWSSATRIAESVLRSPPSDRTRGALFFHNIGIATPWERQRTVQIGRHIFYR
jgi:spore germination cell wall hydrolase CwlJ-like protein